MFPAPAEKILPILLKLLRLDVAKLNVLTSDPTIASNPPIAVIPTITPDGNFASIFKNPVIISITGVNAPPASTKEFFKFCNALFNLFPVSSCNKFKTSSAVPALFSISSRQRVKLSAPSPVKTIAAFNALTFPNRAAISSVLPLVFLLTSSRNLAKPLLSKAAALNCSPSSFAFAWASAVGLIIEVSTPLIPVIDLSALNPDKVNAAIPASSSVISAPACAPSPIISPMLSANSPTLSFPNF